MDPYEIKALENQQEHVGEEKCNEISLEKLAQRMRDSMGYPNLNLNETEIITKCESLVLEKNNVEIWRYYKRRTEKKERPALVMIHGGGWIGGSVSVLENYCKLVAERADAVVFSIEYNKGPEKPFPNAQNDCFNCLKHIYENYEKYKILPSITVGQAILESRWGESDLSKNSNNIFGVKADARWNGKVVEVNTSENYDDKIVAKFRKYDSIKDSINDHGKFLTENKRYEESGLFKATHYTTQAQALEDAGYATKKNEDGELIYADILIDLIKKYNLQLLDREVQEIK